jgi:aryl-alcohol dehydrogenase-like predicted oxidoreductase
VGTTPVDKSIINPHGVISESEAQQIIQEATKAGVTVWDTAEGYGGGTSEKRLERLLPPDASTAIMTKFLPVPWRYSHACFEQAVRESCKRLNVKTIPIYLLHSPVHWRPVEFWVEAAAICKKKGLIQAMGLSNCNADQVQRAVAAGKEYGIDIVTNQVHYSLLCYNSPALQEMETTCRKLNVKIVGFSPIGQGLLTDNLTLERYKSNRPAKMLHLQWDDLVSLRTCLKEMSIKYDKSMAQISLNWCICHDVIPLVGCRSVKQAKDSLGSVGWKLKQEDLEKLDQLALSRSTLQSPGWRRSIFVTLFGIVMIVCRALDWIGYGIVKEASL